jgi:hypothetical protein
MEVPADVTGLVSEANGFRHRPLGSAVLYRGAGATDDDVARGQAAASSAGVALRVVTDADAIGSRREDKLRILGEVDGDVSRAAQEAGWWVDSTPVSTDPAREMLRWAREQAVSERLHRHGNVTGRRKGLAREWRDRGR